MYCRVFATDFDGTSARGGSLAPEVAAALGAARARGVATILVTGRVHEEVEILCGDLSIFDAIVSENGAVVCLPRNGRTVELAAPPPDAFLAELHRRGVPFHVGSVIVGTWDRHAHELLELVRRHALDSQLVFNRGALMLLPSGIDKASGVRRALRELRRSEHNLIAFGDAENDLPMFSVAEIAVAAAGSAPQVAARADVVLTESGPAGVAHYMNAVLEADGMAPSPRRHDLVLDGHDGNARIAASGSDTVIAGGPRSGKSWLVGLIAERLVDRDYRVCLIDPEGDHLELGTHPRVLVLGREIPLPAPPVVAEILATTDVSLVLNLALASPDEQQRYVAALLPWLEETARVCGVPHHVMIDEAHHSLPRTAALSDRPGEARATTRIVATYRPSHLCDDVWSATKAYLVTGTANEEERYFLTSLLQANGPTDLLSHDAFAAIEPGGAGLLRTDLATPTWSVFPVGGRSVPHTHHARKYVDTELPPGQAFWFLHTAGETVVARNVADFHDRIRTVPLASLRHHMAAGDFSNWVGRVLGDESLADILRSIERLVRSGGEPSRDQLIAAIESRYRL